jgi:hypothetical protein
LRRVESWKVVNPSKEDEGEAEIEEVEGDGGTPRRVWRFWRWVWRRGMRRGRERYSGSVVLSPLASMWTVGLNKVKLPDCGIRKLPPTSFLSPIPSPSASSKLNGLRPVFGMKIMNWRVGLDSVSSVEWEPRVHAEGLTKALVEE